MYGIIRTNEDSSRIGYDNNSSRLDPIEFSTFVKDIYLKCKKLGISPSILISWFIDLQTTFGDCDDSRHSNPDYDNNIDLILKSNLDDIQSDPNSKQKGGGGSLTQTQIPLISKV